MKIIAQLLAKAISRIFRGNKPTPKVKPDSIKPAKQVQKQTEQKATTTQTQQADGKQRFWQDKVESDANDPKRAFYEKYRSRLQSQDQQL